MNPCVDEFKCICHLIQTKCPVVLEIQKETGTMCPTQKENLYGIQKDKPIEAIKNCSKGKRDDVSHPKRQQLNNQDVATLMGSK